MKRSHPVRSSALHATAVAVLSVGALGASTANAASTRSADPSSTVSVSNSAQLATALKSVVAGQTISLAKGKYVGKFESSASGTAAAPIALTGPSDAILSTGNIRSGYGLHITGSYWNITGISVTRSGKGIVLDGSKHATISNVDVGHIGDEGVHFRSDSSYGIIQDSSVHDTGLVAPAYGEGIYIGSALSNWRFIMGSSKRPDRSDSVIVRNNRIFNTAAEGVDVKEGTSGGSLTGNKFSNSGFSGENYGDSWVDVKGNGYLIAENSGSGSLLDAFQVHSVASGWGRGNRFTDNTVNGGVPGYEVWVQSSSLNTVVECKTSGAAKGLTNVRCAK